MTAPLQEIARPEWLDREPHEWPPEVRTLFTVLGDIAARRLRRLQQEQDLHEADPPKAAS